MEVMCSFGTSVTTYKTTRRQTPDLRRLQNLRLQNVLYFSFQMEGQCLQVDMEGTSSVPLSVFYDKPRLQIRTERITPEVSVVDP